MGNSLAGVSQYYIGNSKGKVKKKSERYIAKIGSNAIIQETDSTLVLPFRDLKYKEADFIYHFNKKNTCDYELSIACDSCITVYLKNALDDKSYKWQQLNSKTYIAQYSKHQIISLLQSNGKPAMLVTKISLNRKEFANYLLQVK